jgi:hypothetical protein
MNDVSQVVVDIDYITAKHTLLENVQMMFIGKHSLFTRLLPVIKAASCLTQQKAASCVVC